MAKLTNKRRAFIEEYLKCWNATSAARRAGYSFPRRQGSFLLGTVGVQAAIEGRLNDMAETTDAEVVVLSQRFRESKMRRLKRNGPLPEGVIYFLREEHGLVKIGKTIDFERRFRTLQHQIPYQLEIIALIHTFLTDELEEYFHAKFVNKRVKGEWFALSERDIADLQKKWVASDGKIDC